MNKGFKFRPPSLSRLEHLASGGKSGMIATELRTAFEASGFIVEDEARNRAPVNMGMLKNSITHEVDSSSMPRFVEVGTNLFYAPYVHNGRKPGKMPPVEPLKAWVERKQLKDEDGEPLSAWAVAMSIKKKGIKPKPYLTGALEAKQRSVFRQFDKALDRVQAQWHD